MKRLFGVIAITAMAMSCAPMHYVEVTESVAVKEVSMDYSEGSARLLDAQSNFLIMPIVANLEVAKEKIVHVERDAFANIVVNKSSIANIESYKRIALHRAAKTHNADILVSADIEVVTDDGHFVITITGYPAKYKDFRNVTTKELETIKDANEARSSVYSNIDDVIKVQVDR